MKPEDVPEELLQAALGAFYNATGPGVRDDWRAALAAVIPLVEAREREACAGVVECQSIPTFGAAPRFWKVVQDFGRHLRTNLAAAIRARGERT